jgi:hypothetical protein
MSLGTVPIFAGTEAKPWSTKTGLSPLTLLAVPLALVALAVGCNRGEPRGDVVGDVTFDGQPVQAGMVSFEPMEAKAPPRNVPIENGNYRAGGDSGLTPGKYRVRITAADLSKSDPNPPKNINTRVDYVPLLPPPWHTQSKLTVDVKPGKNTFHFHGKKGEEPSVTTAD